MAIQRTPSNPDEGRQAPRGANEDAWRQAASSGPTGPSIYRDPKAQPAIKPGELA